MHVAVGKGLQQSSGRVIALGRLILATLFMLAILLDKSQPAHAPAATYGLLGGYVAFAVAMVIATWRNWWLDARLAGPAHAIDILLFTLLVVLTDGYTSPFFTFFIFILLSAAIRWGWQSTALSAALLTLLYLFAGLVALKSGAPFDPPRFAVRTGHLIIVSLVLIWFGASQRRSRHSMLEQQLLARPSLQESPFETGLRAAMEYARASRGTLIWRQDSDRDLAGLALRDGELTAVDGVSGDAIEGLLRATPMLYRLDKGRALKMDAERNLVAFAPNDVIVPKAASTLGLREGLAVPVRADRAEGLLFLESVSGLSTDHIDLGEQIAADLATHIQRHALLKAAEDSAEARSRLTLARDLHDSVVQFLAGAAFRLEAVKRSKAAGRDIDPEIDELKQLMLQEQRELRTFIKSLRSGPLVPLSELAKDLQALADRLSKQWDVRCLFSAKPAEMMIPTRLRLDAQQLMREAVANAVRHAEAKSVDIGMDVDADELRLEFVNDGGEFKLRGQRLELPASLKERVEHAGGVLDMARGMGVTKLSISLPIGEKRF